MAKQTSPSSDVFPQYFGLTTVESAANTLTFQQLQTGGQLFEKRALIIHRLDYVLSLATWNLLLATGDLVEFGISLSNLLTTIPITDPNVVDLYQVKRNSDGTAASGWDSHSPLVRDFSMLPGGGLIVPAFPIYGFIRGTSLASPGTMAVRGYFTIKELNPQDYVELIQALRVIT